MAGDRVVWGIAFFAQAAAGRARIGRSGREVRLRLVGTVVVVAAVVGHGVDGRDREVLGDLDFDFGPVGLADDVGLVGCAAVDVGLETVDRAGDLGEGGGADLGRGGPGQ